jgi:gluconokinase
MSDASTQHLVPVLVMGVSGSGKTTIGEMLSRQWSARGIPTEFVDADSLHSATNKEKMRNGIALTDEDRWPWLDRCSERIREIEDTGTRCVLANSALKRMYRDRLRRAAPDLFTVFLDGSKDLLEERVESRHHEYMPASLLDSQLATLEPLEADESGIVVRIGQTPEAILAAVDAALAGVV